MAIKPYLCNMIQEDFKFYKPCKELQPYIRYYWVFKSNQPLNTLTFPIGCPQIIFHKQTPLYIPELKTAQSELSTGQLRLAIIGRALIHSPKAFILDEPTVGLDIKAQRAFIKLFEKISKETPIILITHDISEIFPRITNVALIHKQTVYKQGKKEDILTSENLSEIFGN